MTESHDFVEESALFFRLISLVVDVGSEVLRDVLLELVKPDTLETVFQKSHAILNTLVQKRSLFQEQYDLLTKTPPDPEEFDISLLVKIFRNICPSVTPQYFDWRVDPDDDDLSLAADLKRLLNIRNSVYAHRNSTKVTNAEFETLWSDLSDIIDRISHHGSGKHSDIQQRIKMVRQRNLDPNHNGRALETFTNWQKQDDDFKDMIKQRLDKQDEILEDIQRKLTQYTKENEDSKQLSAGSLILKAPKDQRETIVHIENQTLFHSEIQELLNNISSRTYLEKLLIINLSCSDHGGVCYLPSLDLQKHVKLQFVLLRQVSVGSLVLPEPTMTRVCQLIVDNIKLKRHDDIVQLCSSMSSCNGLENLELTSISCSEHGGNCSLSLLDLEQHFKLKWLVLRQVTVKSLKLPDKKRAKVSMFLDNLMIIDHCIEHIYKSLSACYGLEQLELINLSCSAHSARRCHPVLDLQDHAELHRLILKRLTIESLLLPDLEISRGSHLFLENIMISKHCIENIYTDVSSWSNLEELVIIDLSCSVHRGNTCNPALDLAKHSRLQMLLLRQVCVSSLGLPDQNNVRFCNLVLDNVQMTQNDNVQQVCSSVSTLTGLQRLELINLASGDPGASSCQPELDLHKHHTLWWLVLRQLHLGRLHLPDLTEGTVSHLFLEHTVMAHDDREVITKLLSSVSGFQELKILNLSCTEHVINCNLPELDKHDLT